MSENFQSHSQTTPKGLRLHIGLFGRRNTGKSSLMNALTGQELSIVSEHPGTTTDPVEKACEVAPLGPVVFIDTAGLDDEGELGRLRVQKTLAALERVDIAIIVVDDNGVSSVENDLMFRLQVRHIPFVVVFNKSDLVGENSLLLAQRVRLADEEVETVAVSSTRRTGIEALIETLIRLAPEDEADAGHLLGDLVAPGDFVVLVVPIDLGAPKGRLILPQVQALRDILDSGALGLVVKENELVRSLERMDVSPQLVVCDSQVVKKVVADTPLEITLTTFSILMARFKGDMIRLAQGAGIISRLRPGARVLIAEACTHHPQEDDIGRVKIPNWLRQFAGGPLEVDVKSGNDFPEDLTPYSLIVQCGGCMITRKQMLARQYRASRQGVPMTNYGMAISVVQGVLERSLAVFPEALEAYCRAMNGTVV